MDRVKVRVTDGWTLARRGALRAKLVASLYAAWLMGFGAVVHAAESMTLSPAPAAERGSASRDELPTTADIKMVGRRPYLRLEQARSEVTTRVLLLCLDHKLTLGGGIVTDEAVTRAKARRVTRSYFEFDGAEVLPVSGTAGVTPSGPVLWVRRELDENAIRHLLKARRLLVWTENGSDFRWGAPIDLFPVRSHIDGYIRACSE